MDPKLIAFTGPLKGSVFPLSEDRISVGREKGNTLLLESKAVSRRHCLIERRAEGFKVTDLGSTNGTFVNGIPFKTSHLKHGDQVRIGDSLFLFSCRDSEPDALLEPLELEDRELEPRTTTEISFEESASLHLEGLLRNDSTGMRMNRDLPALLRFAAAIGSSQDLDSLQRRFLESIFEVTPAERGTIVLVGKSPIEITSAFMVDRELGRQRRARVNRAIVRRVLETGVSVLTNYAKKPEELGRTKSLAGRSPTFVLAAPIMTLEKKLGAVCLEAGKSHGPFDEGHLQLTTTMASLVAPALNGSLHLIRLEMENQRLFEEARGEYRMVGESPAMCKVYDFINKVAATDSTVLVCGESGTGKELVARALHEASPRAKRPFVAIDCATLPENLLESELFGHERGAFTGATEQKKGKLEAADGGTVFLDEIGELAVSLQPKLLRVLQEHEYERVGGTRPITLDIRVIAATNRDLMEGIKSGTFREDLYFRLNVVSVSVPPLRDRREDIPLLASFFAAKYGAKCKRPVAGISPTARDYLMNYHWPGNVRELENAIERAVVLGSSPHIGPEDLPEAVLEAELQFATQGTKYHETVKQFKKQLILRAVKESKGSHVKAAEAMGLHPTYLSRLVRNMNLKAALRDC